MAATVEEIQEFIAHANGADHMVRHPLTGMTYSSGMGWIAENAGAYWLIDAILINSKHKRLQEVCEGFEVLTAGIHQRDHDCGQFLADYERRRHRQGGNDIKSDFATPQARNDVVNKGDQYRQGECGPDRPLPCRKPEKRQGQSGHETGSRHDQKDGADDKS